MERESVLLIGAAGFVGGHLLEYLSGKDGLAVSAAKQAAEAIDRDRFPGVAVHDIDILDRASVDAVIAAVRPARLVHLAAQSSVALSWKDPVLTMSLNVNGTLNVLDAVRAAVPECRVLLVGSSEQYGRIRPEMLPVNEDAPLAPESPYAISKAAQEMMASLYARSYGMDIVLVRAFNHIGPGQSPAFVVADFAKQIAEIEQGLRPPVLKVGNLSARRDFTDVRDIVRGYWLLLEKGSPGAVYNIGQGCSIPVEDVLAMLTGLSLADITVETDPDRFRPADVPDIVADIGRIQADTGWAPSIGIRQSLEDTIAYWRKHAAGQ